MQSMAKFFIFLGILFLMVGVFIWLFGNWFSWFGKLPGDIRIERENFVFYAPITSMILLSIILNLIFWILAKLFMR
ncbi:MAG: DUF2905 domain-containing protein [Chlorobi bacterium]|nr:DUF2905 domain-containing protein [Chlorobiota bacterium]